MIYVDTTSKELLRVKHLSIGRGFFKFEILLPATIKPSSVHDSKRAKV
jgi:hypothetical protein